MGFGKDYQEDLSFDVIDARHPGEIFTFHLAKRPAQEATDAMLHFIGLPDDEAKEVRQAAQLAAVAKLATRAPEGFAGFPTDERSLEERFLEYFSNPKYVEMPGIIRGLWEEFLAVAVPTVYLKSLQDTGSGMDSVPAGTSTPTP
jgi:hypothetical protein